MRRNYLGIIFIMTTFLLNGCASTAGDVMIGIGVGAVGAVSGVYCALECKGW